MKVLHIDQMKGGLDIISGTLLYIIRWKIMSMLLSVARKISISQSTEKLR